MVTLPLSAVKARFSEVIREVRATGEPVTITVDGEPAVVLSAAPTQKAQPTAFEVDASLALYEAILAMPRPDAPFDAVESVRAGRR
jgi:prevent-host-death family protein